jgi:hypothetical protein
MPIRFREALFAGHHPRSSIIIIAAITTPSIRATPRHKVRNLPEARLGSLRDQLPTRIVIGRRLWWSSHCSLPWLCRRHGGCHFVCLFSTVFYSVSRLSRSCRSDEGLRNCTYSTRAPRAIPLTEEQETKNAVSFILKE